MTTEIRFFALKSKKEKGTVMDRGQNGFNVKTTTQRVSRMYFRLSRSTPVAQSAPRNLLTRWDVSSIPANGIFLTKN